MQTGVEIMMTEDQPLVISLQTGIQWESSQLAKQEAADSGSLFLRS